MIDRDLLKSYAADYGVSLTDKMCDRFDRYAALLVEWNQKMNLTAICEPQDIVLKHFADSLTALPLLPKTEGVSLIDVGTGAGFPALPLKIVREDLTITLLDSLNKRLTFLKAVCDELGLANVRFVHARAEDGGKDPALRESFDIATARAVAALPLLSEYCLPFVKVGGRFIAMKGPDSEKEAEDAARAINLLGGDTPQVTTLTLPKTPRDGVESGIRRLFLIEKRRKTPPSLPRPSAKIKNPL